MQKLLNRIVELKNGRVLDVHVKHGQIALSPRPRFVEECINSIEARCPRPRPETTNERFLLEAIADGTDLVLDLEVRNGQLVGCKKRFPIHGGHLMT